MIKLPVDGTAGLQNFRKEVAQEKAIKIRKDPHVQVIGLKKIGRVAFMLKLLYLIACVIQRGMRTETIRPIFKLIGFDATVGDISATLGRFNYQGTKLPDGSWQQLPDENKCVRFKARPRGGRLIAIGVNDVAFPEKEFIAVYNKSGKTYRKPIISRKETRICMQAPNDSAARQE